MIDTEYEGQKIAYNEEKELWICTELDLDDASLSGLKKKIYRYLYRQKTKDLKSIPVLYRYWGCDDSLKAGLVTSLVERGSSSELLCRISYVKDEKKLSESVDTSYVYRIDEEILDLMQALKTVKKKLNQWLDDKKHWYSRTDLCRDLGYSKEVAKDSFRLDI